MVLNEIKEILIETFEKLEGDENLKSSALAFIRSYNGTNNTEFTTLMTHLAIFLAAAKRHSVKAAGFDELEEAGEDFNESFSKIKRDFKRLSADKDPIQPATPSN